jgi:hypothetical protein
LKHKPNNFFMQRSVVGLTLFLLSFCAQSVEVLGFI